MTNLHPAATAFKETDGFQYQNDEQFDKTLDTSIAVYFYNNKAEHTHNVYFSLNGDSEPSTHIESTTLNHILCVIQFQHLHKYNIIFRSGKQSTLANLYIENCFNAEKNIL